MKTTTEINKNNTIEGSVSLPFKGVIFDMDGTLIESTEADYLAWKRLFADYQKPLSYEDYFPLLGAKSAVVVQSRLHLDEEQTKVALAKKLKYFTEIVSQNGIQPVPFAIKLLEQLQQYDLKIALATSSRREKMKMVLKLTGLLPYFEVIVTGEEVSKSKPAPDIFLIAAKKLELPPDQCLVIEDAVNGIKAAKNAGMKCIAITTTHSSEMLQEADLIIDTYEAVNFQDLCSVLLSN
ncbi:MAG TPA: HAD family phosphatase [Chitinophagaceae bacterium]|jgi:beta-phosphoglucomutase family hydrolase